MSNMGGNDKTVTAIIFKSANHSSWIMLKVFFMYAKIRQVCIFLFSGFILTIVFTSSLGCNAAPQESEVELVIFYSADLSGYLEPCGWGGNQQGGLARRATYIKKQNIENALLVDAGGFNFGSGTLNKFKSEYLLQGLKQLDYTGINLSWRDLIHGPEFLNEMQKEQESPLLSANVYVKETGKRFCSPYSIQRLTLKGKDKSEQYKVRLGIVGLAQPSSLGFNYPGGIAKFEIRDPLDEARKIITELKPKCDYILALLYMDGATAFNLVQEVGDIDIAIMGKPGYKYERPQVQNGVLFLSGGHLGKFARYAEVVLSPEKGVISFKSNIKNLDKSVPDDPELAQVVQAYQQRLQDWRKELFAKTTENLRRN